MPVHQYAVSQQIACVLKGATVIPLLIAALLVSASGKAEDLNMPNPENVLVLPSDNLFSRWTVAPVPAASPRPEQTQQRIRTARTKPRTNPPAEPYKVTPDATEPDWPNAAATVGSAAILPLTIKTVREMVEPEPDAPLVFENELSDIDLAAGPALEDMRSSARQAVTDGSGAIDNGATEQAGAFSMGETAKAAMQSAWLEPLLLVLAGALASFAAVRIFA